MTRARLDSVITVLDADYLYRLLDSGPFNPTGSTMSSSNITYIPRPMDRESNLPDLVRLLPEAALSQLQAADIILVNKSDLVSTDQYDANNVCLLMIHSDCTFSIYSVYYF